MLSALGFLQPEIMMNVLELAEGQSSLFGSFLQRKGLTQGDLYAGMSSPNWQVMGNRKVMWSMRGHPYRKGAIISHDGDVSQPGLNGATFNVYVNTDWFGVMDRLWLVDHRTQLHILAKERGPAGSTRYTVVLVTNRTGAYCEPTLLLPGKEIGVLHNAHPELSEDASEKNTGIEWHAEWMTIQRMKHTISGTAKAERLWIEHNGQRMWDYTQNIEMMKRWGISLENQLLWGKSTVDQNDRVYMKDMSGRDIVSGNGLREQGDPSMKWQYNTLNIRQIERIMENMSLTASSDGSTELVVTGGIQFCGEFDRLFRDVLQMNPEPLYFEQNGEQGIRSNFKYYDWNGIKLHVLLNRAQDQQWTPTERDSSGDSTWSRTGFFVSLGNTVSNQPNLQLIALGNEGGDRRFVQRVITGMANRGNMPSSGSGTDRIMYASSPVDGEQVHVLSEVGLVLRNPLGFAELTPARPSV